MLKSTLSSSQLQTHTVSSGFFLPFSPFSVYWYQQRTRRSRAASSVAIIQRFSPFINSIHCFQLRPLFPIMMTGVSWGVNRGRVEFIKDTFLPHAPGLCARAGVRMWTTTTTTTSQQVKSRIREIDFELTASELLYSTAHTSCPRVERRHGRKPKYNYQTWTQ